jgi:hypothetical protein
MIITIYKKKCLKCGKSDDRVKIHKNFRLIDLQDGDASDEGSDFTGYPSSCCMAGTVRRWRNYDVKKWTVITWDELPI